MAKLALGTSKFGFAVKTCVLWKPVYDEAIYNVYRTLKRWTTRTLWGETRSDIRLGEPGGVGRGNPAG